MGPLLSQSASRDSRNGTDPARKAHAPATSQANTWSIVLRCFGYLRPYWRLIAGVYATLLVLTGLNLIVPQIIRLIVDRAIVGHNLNLLALSVLGLLALSAFDGIFTFLQG